ncbi:MAG: choice-of-anchor D domain-containing protein [Deltaproteobacteria bacterium]|nr:choice-of-anchor D domain-containing protein [Deltaproteobacteria bacterium]
MDRLYPVLVLLLCFACPGCNEDVVIEAPPVMQVGIDSIEFGAIAVGRTVTRDVVVQNAGASDLRLDQPSFLDDPDSVFGIDSYEAIIPPASYGIVSVAFSPRDIAIEIEPDLIDFGTVNAGEVGLGEVFIRNIGSGNLLITNIELGPATSSDFQILSSTRPSTLASGGEVSIRLAYRPGAESFPPGQGRLMIDAADPFQPHSEVTLVANLNRAPVADAGPDQDVDPLDEVFLDGSHSTDPDGDLPLSYAWTLVRKPEGSSSVLFNTATAQPGLIPDLVGVYEAELFVTDSTDLRSLLPDRVVITSVPAERLLLELVWDSPIADLDLHFIAPGGAFGGLLDCFYGNREPDWGDPGNPVDDPQLKRDDLMGFGPETIGYNEPVGGTFQILVDYFAAHTPSGQEPTTVSLRVFVDGILVAEIVKRLDSQGQLWTVGTVKWPEGTVVEIDLLE